jgi:hypothetical protein
MAACTKTVGHTPGPVHGAPVACGKPAAWFGYIMRSTRTRRGGVVTYRCDDHKGDLLEPVFRCGEPSKEDSCGTSSGGS